MTKDEELTFSFSGGLDPNDPLHQYQVMFNEMLDKAAPPEEVQVERLETQVAPDGRRVRVHLRLTMYRFRPHLVLSLWDPAGQQVAEVDIIEPMSPDMEFTLHVREPQPGEYTVRVDVRYPTPEHMPKTPEEQRITRGELKPLPPMRTVTSREVPVRLLPNAEQAS
ncbi:MAG: hypothetical protein GXO56_07635 [Chloroflexi bacterium]|nr:hypothetical protein [Chloroflexota bacterium]